MRELAAGSGRPVFDHAQNSIGSEARYRAIVDTAVDAIVVINEAGEVQAFNPAAEHLFGYDANEMFGRNVKVLMPEPHHTAHDGYLERYETTGERRIIGIGREVAGLRKDGSTFPLELSVAEWRSDGVRYFTGVMRDVTERKRAEEHTRLLVNELNHRVKNTLATVQSIARQTLGNAVSLIEARDAITARLVALARAHDVLTRENWDSADLSEVVSGALKVHDGPERFRINGPAARLAPTTALALSMALHELLTNALKYGALSDAFGCVYVTWDVRRASDEARLRLRWQEHGGPPVLPPTRKGFGSRLIETGLARELGGEVRLEFMPSGVICVIDAPLAEADAIMRHS